MNKKDVTNYLEQPLKDEASQFYLPLPRHRRRIIFNLIKPLKFDNYVDVGCAQGDLIDALAKRFQVKGYGCDISEEVVNASQQKLTQAEFRVLNISEETWPNKQFDLVVCSEVLEHIIKWEDAVKNLTSMTKRYLLITVPGGKLRKTDKMVGHYRHFQGDELIAVLNKNAFTPIKVIRHGFPVHSIYKWLINLLMPEKLYHSFHHKKQYSVFKKMIAHLLYGLFFINYFFTSGSQLYILAERA